MRQDRMIWKAVAAVTKADVLRAAKQYIHPENFVIVAVGNPKEFGKPLDSLGKVTAIDLTIPEPKPQVSKIDSKTLAKGKQLLQKTQQALGGADKLAAVKDLRLPADDGVKMIDGRPRNVSARARRRAATAGPREHAR